MKNPLNKLPYVKCLLLTIDALKEEVRSRDEFGEKLIGENESLTAEVERWKNDYADLTARLRDSDQNNNMWHKRWCDEHEKYVDLCDQLRAMMIQLKDSAENVLAHTTIDT